MRNVYRPFVRAFVFPSSQIANHADFPWTSITYSGPTIQIEPLIEVINGKTEYLQLDKILNNVVSQVESAGWGLQSSKLRGTSIKVLTPPKRHVRTKVSYILNPPRPPTPSLGHIDHS